MPYRFSCPWDSQEVEIEGATCDSMCYMSWIAWQLSLVTTPRLVLLEPDETPPLDLNEQPWYSEEIGVD